MTANKPFEADIRKRASPLAQPLNGDVMQQLRKGFKDGLLAKKRVKGLLGVGVFTVYSFSWERMILSPETHGCRWLGLRKRLPRH